MLTAARSRHLRQEADFLISQGHFTEAEGALADMIRALGDPQTTPLRIELCSALVAHAGILRWSNRWEEALEAVGRAERLAETLPALLRRGNLMSINQVRAKIHATEHSPVFSIKAAENDLQRVRDVVISDWAWVADELEADLAFQVREWQRAIALGNRVIDALDAGKWLFGAAAMRRRVAEACLESGDLARAETLLMAALPHAREFGPPDLLAGIEIQIARLRSRQGKHEEAWEVAAHALDLIDTLIRNFRVLTEQQRFLIDKLTAYRQTFVIALAGGRAPKWLFRAWSVAERAKSFYLCQLVANTDVPLFVDVDPAMLHRIKDLEEKLDALERTRQDERTPQADREKREAELQATYAERQTLTDSIMNRNPSWAALRPPPRLSLEDELSSLQTTDAGWIPLSYYWEDQAEGGLLHLFYSQAPGTVNHEPVSWSSEERQRLRTAADALTGRVRAGVELLPDELLEKTLPAALRAKLESRTASTVLISPHLELNKLPLHALGDEGERLIDSCAVQYIPTLALLPLRRERGQAGKVALIGCTQDGFGDPPLEHIDDEIEGIVRAWTAHRPGSVDAATIPADGTLADAGLSISEWNHYEYLHIACHGVFPESRPFDAALRLGREAVRASELFGTKLCAALVTLSACALGRRAQQESERATQSDEWIGIYLPLFYAGASSLLVSLWDADSEAAAKVMVALHQRIATGCVSPAIGLRDALATVGDRPTPHWANWYLVGVPEKLQS